MLIGEREELPPVDGDLIDMLLYLSQGGLGPCAIQEQLKFGRKHQSARPEGGSDGIVVGRRMYRIKECGSIMIPKFRCRLVGYPEEEKTGSTISIEVLHRAERCVERSSSLISIKLFGRRYP